ncbi:non-ribosomal peptide synthetase [Pseudomonas sp. GV071]|uniref:non-ribosomal peptide synthetase n=1 Tax=Pseudomonas sp. GV071 TaxID=2135754 RepID=UPI000D34EDAB|nr:non-ribosomal peptide synthetase [Pseudomonas sp. GV071]PTQ68386.1 non-ribosomal peptide synthase protein (TIGR01720 family)/amino acid adenylation domain-containing protein [Pseudomonas sp. GV071]
MPSFELPRTLVHALQRRAAQQPDALALRFLEGDDGEGRVLSYAELDGRARTIAAALQSRTKLGDRAVLLFPSGPDYVAAFFGCLYAGVIAVPAYPPESSRHQHQLRLLSILDDAEPRLLLTSSDQRDSLQHIDNAPELLLVDDLDPALAASWQAPELQADDIAFLQYTSGSTALPKGVQVSHGNLVANELLIRQGFGIQADDVIVSWLPLYHDMGLIGGLLQPIFSGVPCVLMSPKAFLERPVRWLEAISRYGGTVSGGPDFAYRLCSERVSASALATLDLSGWRVAFSGSEPIRQDSLERFAQKFAAGGFNASSYLACYGLAEATLYVTSGVRGEGIPALGVSAEALTQNRIEAGGDSLLLSCGTVRPLHQVRIVDPATLTVLGDNQVGEVWACGPSIAHGYWRNAEATAKSFVALDGHTWLRTGDLGALRDGELFISGRLKDMLIVRGHNLYPQDIERTVETDVSHVRKGRVAAFAVQQDGEEGIGIAAEIGRSVQKNVPAEALINAIRQAVAEAYQEAPRVVVLLNPGALPKTSSGKLQRSACRLGLDDGSLDSYAQFPADTAARVPGEAIETDQLQAQIAALWAEHLHVPNVAPKDNFFLLGGNSIVAAQLMAQLRDQLGVNLELRHLFETRHLGGFASKVAEQLAQGGAAEGAIPRLSRQQNLPQSAAQNRLWFLWQLDPDSAAYNIPGGLHLRGELDDNALRASFARLIQRHEALRTVFLEEGGEALQRIQPSADLHLREVDLRHLSGTEQQDEAARLREQEANAPFDLTHGPLLRVTLLRLADEEQQLLVTLHHIVADGWSLNVLLDEFSRLYAEACGGQPADLAPLPLGYADFASWQRQWLAAGEGQRQLAYWTAQLGDEAPALQLPLDYPRSAQRQHSAARFTWKLDDALSQRLREIARGQQATLFMLLLAGFQSLLLRHTGQTDLRIGVPGANRQRLETQGLLGFFINTLVLRGQLDPRQPFTEVLTNARAATLEAQANQDLPFDQLVQALGGTTPFQVMFNHQQRDLSSLRRLPGLLAQELPWHSREAKFDLQLHSEEDARGRLTLSFDYADELFSAATIQRLAQRLVSLLQQVAEQPQLAVGAIELMSADEQQQLAEWNRAPLPSPTLLLPQWLEQHRADDIALLWQNQRFTYGQLHAEANSLAQQLRELGVGPDVRVAIAAERSPELLVGLLAIVKAGGAYVPLDADYPRERLAYMLEDSGATLLLTQAHLRHALPVPAQVQVLELAPVGSAARTVALTSTPYAVSGDNLAYVIYTSGSTGQPKGVGVTHAALAERLSWMQATYQLDASDVLMQKAPVSFDVSVWECFWPLITGARLLMAAPGEHRDPQRLVQLVREHGVTTLHFVPPLLQLFVQEADVVHCNSLRRLFSGGEALPAALRDRVLAALPTVALHNRYGPTETAINVSHWHCQASDGERSPIGRPLGNVLCHVLDAELQPVPVGVAGELCIGGAGLARGYLGRPGLTAERFIADPLGEPGARLYRTGDRVRWGADGALEYLGRLDQQVKLRGFRIEPEEIQARLLAEAGVGQAVVVIRDGHAGAQLIGYYTSTVDTDETVQSQRLLSALSAQLPDYMVPSQLLRLAHMPLSPAGKLDRQALPEPLWQQGQHIEPSTPLQVQIAAIWREVLGLPQVGLADDFFQRGGHSLLATQIVSRTRQACDVELPLRVLFEASTLQAFSAQVAAAQAAGQRNSQQAIAIVDRSQPLPLSYSQQRMWFLWQLEPDSPAYNVGGLAKFTGAFDVARFEAALQALIQRHETLRTTFPSRDGIAWQQVAPQSNVQLGWQDFSKLNAAERQQRLQQFADADAHQPFNLERGPLLRASLVKCAEREHYLVLTLHHIATEGWAMDIFARELAALYEAFVDERESPLAPLPVQYLDYSQWQRQWMEAGERQRQLDYWLKQLGDEHPVLDLPGDRPRPALQSHRGELYRFDLSSDLAQRLRAFNSAHGLTLFMTMTASLAILLQRYSGQSDLRIGAPVANRIRPESEGLIGAFLNTQVLRCQVDGQLTVLQLLEQVRQTVIDGQSHQDLPFDHLVDTLQPPRSAAYNPLFQVMCNVQRWEFQQTRELAGMSVEYIANDARATKFDLNLEVTDLDHRLGCCFTYSCDLFDEPRIARMASHLVNLLDAMLATPQQRLAELPLLTADEQQHLLANLSEEAGEHALDNTVHALFAAQAAATPTAPALTFAGHTLSYAELDAQANRLAHWLREQGVGPEVRVGLALPRSTELVVGLLAILKAGGAYVPLDPEYPQERLYYMIDDSGIRLLLGQAELFDSLGELPARVLRCCLAELDLSGYPSAAPDDRSSPLHQAYLIYTSGSTGKPKGVVVSQGEIAMHCRAVISRFGMRPDDCELHFYSINFDAASERLLTPLLCGAQVVLRAQGQWDAQEICALIRQHQVSILGFTPSYGSQLAQWLASRNEQLPVRLCITGGEALTAEHLQRIRGGFAPAQFFNAYGPTETVVMPLASLAPEQMPEGASSVAIGNVVGARSAYVLDADLALVPPGSTGELYIGGAGLARGYHARPSLSAERFVPNPFANSATGGRLYRTGDLVRQRADGLLEYVGRIDQQVKVRGFRIELGEIEARLLEHSAVDQCVVLALDGASGKQLVAYIASAVASADSEAQQALRDSLKRHVLAQLPEHMLPTFTVLLPSLPLTANGKVERRALPAPDQEQNRQHFVAPRSAMEHSLATIWREVLNVQQVGLADNFFELGGDSILSIQVVSRARQQGIHFSPRDLFQHQTVKALASVASHQQQVLSEQGALSGEAPLTPIQQWFFSTAMATRNHWNQSLVLQPQQVLDVGLLRKSMQRLVVQHDALRLRFSDAAGHWQAHYNADAGHEPVLWHAQVKDFNQAERLFADAQCSLDLQQGPLLRALLLDGPGGAQKLLIAIHHLVVDGVSWRVLLDDLQSTYRQLHAGQSEVQLPAKTTSMGEWAARLTTYASSESLREELGWWQQHLSGPVAELPGVRRDGSHRERDAQTISLRLDAERTRQLLSEAPAAYRTQVNDLLLTALARVLCRWTGEPSTLIQLEGHGREALFDELDLTRSVGWFTSAYPLRLQAHADLGTALKATKEQLRNVPHKGLGYGVLRYLADPASCAAIAALPKAKVTFNYLGQLDQSPAGEALLQLLDDHPGAIHAADAPLPNELSIDGQVLGGELQLRWTYSRERFDEHSVHALAQDLINELHGLIEHCLQAGNGGFTPSDFPLAHLSQDQLDQLPVPAAQIDDVYPLTPMQEGLLLHTLLEPGTGIYYMQDRYRINSALDPARFAQAWQAVVARHEALRASFAWNAGEAMLQIIHKPGAAELDVLDWSDLPAEEHEARLQALHKSEREAGFELLQRPPFHLRLIKLEQARYWFMMSNHHILIDAWCRGLLMSDFFEIYAALAEQCAPQLPLAPRYRDYISWLQRQDLNQARHWWQANLAGFERRTHIPRDRPIVHDHAGDNGGMLVGDRYTRLLASEGAQLRELAQRHQLTVNTFAQAAWALVLRRYSGERDVLFGVTVAGRPVGMPDMQRTVGLFINSVALRVKVPAPGEQRSVRDWLQGLFAGNMDLREHEYLPLVAIQECSELPKGQPLFDSLFVFENAPVESGVLDQAQSVNATSDSGRTHTNFPLTVVCYPGDDLGLHLSYDQRYFEGETIERLLGEFKRLLLALAEHFHGDMAELPLLGAAEQQLLTETCNQSERHYPLEQGYARLFEAQVAAAPQRVVASYLDQQWSYSALNQRANRLGHALLAAGVKIDQPVALLAERSLDLLGMIVGSFKAGAGYLPLDPGHPVQRLTRIIELSRTPVLVCSRSCREQAQALLEELGCSGRRPKLLVWDDVQAGPWPGSNPGVYSAANNLAYVIYTSGSTGLPKGVMVEQAGMLNNQLSKVPYLQLGADDVIAQTASQSFDISVWQFLAAPLFGARVAIVPNAIAHDPQALLAHVAEQRISVLESVPSLIQGMLAEEVQHDLHTLRWMLPTGEAMPPELARQWLQRFPAVGLVNAYGPAECSDDVAFFRVDQASTQSTYLPIGSPTDNNRLYLLDEALELVPLGAVGELCVAGTGVGRGYVGDPQRTAQAFVPNPFAPDERLYRSGDLARRRADGVLEYVGRIDHQVKIRGFRIELGEIEARLHEQADIRDAAVAVQEGPTGKYLVGYLVASAAQQADSPGAQVLEQGLWFEQIKQRLRSDLPDYMVPLHWQVLERLPLNANGKLDRKALPALDFGSLSGQTYVAPRSELEQQLAEIWAQVLKVERVGVHDNFFELGGHSLLATQIASRVQKVLQRNVPLRAMFECSSVAELAEYVGGLDSQVVAERKAEKVEDLMARFEAM